MITFRSRNQDIRTMDKITRAAHGTYPHISPTRVYNTLEESGHLDTAKYNICYKYQNVIMQNRQNMNYYEDNLNQKAIELIRNLKVGNCFEDSCLAQTIAQINGQNNVYLGVLGFYTSRHEQNEKPAFNDITDLDHCVAFLTDKDVEIEVGYPYKNKEAIICDPWLGITDYAGNYFKKFQSLVGKMFNIDKFSSDIKFCLTTFNYSHICKDVDRLKKLYPELLLDNFKAIKLIK
jgi:hypothetical protein